MKKTMIAVASAVLLITLAGCANTPPTGSAKESAYIKACSAAGGQFIPGSETPGSSYRSMCAFRYPALPLPLNGK